MTETFHQKAREIWHALNDYGPFRSNDVSRVLYLIAKGLQFEAEDWQPIESAPTDGTPILARGVVCGHNFTEIIRWCTDPHNRRPRPYWECNALDLTEMRKAKWVDWKHVPGGASG